MRIAHLFYEMLVRYRMVELTDGNSFVFPVTQADLADATGLTPVHANRMLRQLRADGLLEFKSGVVTVLDPDQLKQAAQFTGTYLHLDRVHDRSPASQRSGLEKTAIYMGVEAALAIPASRRKPQYRLYVSIFKRNNYRDFLI